MNKIFKIPLVTVLLVALITLNGCQDDRMTVKEQITQKIMLDLRYFCPEMTDETAGEKNDQCKTPVTTLPPALAKLISDTSLGSVILFSENIVNTEQIIRLTSDLQNAALRSTVGQPLIISVDQEGGRVVRLPRNMATSFTGNMSIGATYKNHGNKYARQVGEVLGSELKVLGFNVDHAPDVDVNVNPENPVINVRSFSESPEMVADLGIAMLEGMQAKGVVATLKHFPGHGDTNTDSHTGLPVVEHDLATVKKVDLYPFQQAIDNSNVQMIMTAHIQYPALDSSIVVNKFGQSMIKPATLSKKILTDLLRGEMGYQGIIITDALDMAGIANFFTPIEAVLNTFEAGADIAMMPMKIRKPADIERFKIFIRYLADRVAEEQSIIEQFNQSVQRILQLKKQFVVRISSEADIAKKVHFAQTVLANKAHRALELELAQHAIVEIKKSVLVSEQQKKINKVHIIFPKEHQSATLKQYLESHFSQNMQTPWQVTMSSFRHIDQEAMFAKIAENDFIIVASDSQKTAVDLGSVEDLTSEIMNKEKLGERALTALKYAKEQGKTTLFVSLKLPSKLKNYYPYSDWILATFDGQCYFDDALDKYVGPTFDVLAEVILGKLKPEGQLPITL